MITKSSFCFTLLFPLLGLPNAEAAALTAVEWFSEPSGLRVVDQSELAGVIKNDSSNMDVTQIFTVNSSGSVSAIGLALGAAGGTPSLTASLYRVSNGVVQPSAFAASILLADYFAGIGPQTVPVWAYAEFSTLAPVIAGEQIAFRIQSPFAELWGPRTDVLQGAELVEIPGTDLAFRAYVIPEPATGVLSLIGCSLLFFTSTRASLCEKGWRKFRSR